MSSVGRTSRQARCVIASGWSSPARKATSAPRSWPARAKRSWPRAVASATMSAAIVRLVVASRRACGCRRTRAGRGRSRCGRSRASAATCRHIRWVCGKPCRRTIGGPSPPDGHVQGDAVGDRDATVVEAGDGMVRSWAGGSAAGQQRLLRRPGSRGGLGRRGRADRPQGTATPEVLACWSSSGCWARVDGLGRRRGAVALKGPRHRRRAGPAVVARGRVVPGRRAGRRPVGRSAGGVRRARPRTFVARAAAAALEPERRAADAVAAAAVTAGAGLRAARPSRTPSTLGASGGRGAAARRRRGRPRGGARRLREALGLWRGPAYADFADARGHGPSAPGWPSCGSRPSSCRAGAARARPRGGGGAGPRSARGRAPVARGRVAAARARPLSHRPPGRRPRGAAPRAGAAGRAARRWTRAPRCSGWRRTSSTTPITSPRRDPSTSCGPSGRRLRPHGRRRGAGAAGVDRRRCCATSPSPVAARGRPRGIARPPSPRPRNWVTRS